MTNLLPPQAKKQIVVEYWVRVVCVWIMLWSGCLLVGSLLLWPTYVLLSGNNQAYADSVNEATERNIEYTDLSRILSGASKQAESVIQLSQKKRLSEILSDIWGTVDSSAVEVATVNINRVDGQVQAVFIAGQAQDRLSLAAFRDNLEALAYVTQVDLPIENLAQNQDIPFSLTVNVDNDNL